MTVPGRNTRLELVLGATIRTLGGSGVYDIEKDPWMHVPDRGAIGRTVKGEVFGSHHDWVQGGRPCGA